MNKFLRVLFIILAILVGATFIYSAYTKLNPIQPFEYTMVEFVHLPWLVAALAARFLVGLEGGLGILIALHLFGRGKWVLKTAFAILVIFSIYLLYLWLTAGNNVNCGCFGDAIWMSPSASLIKNAILLLVTGLLLRYHTGISGKHYNIYSPTLLLLTITIIFILFALPVRQPNWLRTDRYNINFTEVGLSGGATPFPLYGPVKQDTTAAIARPDLTKGKYIIAFLSQTCPHCRIAAYKMHLLKQADPNIPFFMVIGGTSELTDFFKNTKATDIPYTRLDKDHFLHYTGGIFPLIIWVNNGVVEAKADYNTLTQAEIEKWLK